MSSIPVSSSVGDTVPPNTLDMGASIPYSNEMDNPMDISTADNVKSMKITIKNYTAVATWRWVANDDNCGICRMPFDGCCPDCKMPGDDCPLVWGRCSHCFHIHCIMKWLTSQQVHQLCPMCRQEWKFKE
ncbi:Anaphase-promoting complex subunit 11, partial [Stegodyphus mimosarum]